MISCPCTLPSPGGLLLTKHALDLCRFAAGALLADIGCGTGENVRYINENTDFTMVGVDNDPSVILPAAEMRNDCLCGNASALPFPARMFDGVFFECSFSKFAEPDIALGEAARVLKTGGKLVIADFYAREAEAVFTGVMGRVERRGKIAARLRTAGFSVPVFEDRTHDLRELWGQLIFDYGTEALDDLLGGSEMLSAAKCGYGLFIAKNDCE